MPEKSIFFNVLEIESKEPVKYFVSLDWFVLEYFIPLLVSLAIPEEFVFEIP